MEATDNFYNLSNDFKAHLTNLKISRWEHFAVFTLERLLDIPNITLSDVKTISRRLHLMGLEMEVTRTKLDEYYLRVKNMTYEEVKRELLLDALIDDIFSYRTRILTVLKKVNVKTLRDLTSLSIMEVYKLEGIGKTSIMEIQNKIIEKGLSFAN